MRNADRNEGIVGLGFVVGALLLLLARRDDPELLPSELLPPLFPQRQLPDAPLPSPLPLEFSSPSKFVVGCSLNSLPADETGVTVLLCGEGRDKPN